MTWRSFCWSCGARAGDGAAFAELMRRFGNRTFGYLRGLIGNAAEDLQQDVWLAVYRSISALSNPRAFRTWLFRTTRHRAIDFLRRQRRERELLVDADVQALESVADGDAVSGIAEHASDERESLLDGVLAEAQLSSLSPLHREVLLLRFRDGMSYAEIALVVGCSIGTVRSRLHHAKRRLHERLTRGVQ
jgi:RNA polymerase sigma-70 factor, ECF subfamily